jgi:hypothetical protein
LWRAGIFAHVNALWVAIGMIIALGLGILLAVTSPVKT